MIPVMPFLEQIALNPDDYSFTPEGYEDFKRAVSDRLVLISEHNSPLSGNILQRYLALTNPCHFFKSTSFAAPSLEAFTQQYHGVGYKYDWTAKFTSMPIPIIPEATNPANIVTKYPIVAVFTNGVALDDRTEYDVFSDISTAPVVFVDSLKLQPHQNIEVMTWMRKVLWWKWYQKIVPAQTSTFVVTDIPTTLWGSEPIMEGAYGDLIMYYRKTAFDTWKLVDPYRTVTSVNKTAGTATVAVSNFEFTSLSATFVMNNAATWELSKVFENWGNFIPLLQGSEQAYLDGYTPVGGGFDSTRPLPCTDPSELLVLVHTIDSNGVEQRDKLVPFVDYFLSTTSSTTQPGVVLKQSVSPGTRVRVLKVRSKNRHLQYAYRDDINSDSEPIGLGVVRLPTLKLPASVLYTDITINNRHIPRCDWHSVADKMIQIDRANSMTNFYLVQSFEPTSFVDNLLDVYDEAKSPIEKLFCMNEYWSDPPATQAVITPYTVGTNIVTNLTWENTTSDWESTIYSKYYQFSVIAETSLYIAVTEDDFVNRLVLRSGSLPDSPIIAQSFGEDVMKVQVTPGTYLLEISHIFDEYTAKVP